LNIYNNSSLNIHKHSKLTGQMSREIYYDVYINNFKEFTNMTTLSTLTNDLLIDAYYSAIELKLSNAFINLLLLEIKARKINIMTKEKSTLLDANE
jgi:hypothetical protein